MVVEVDQDCGAMGEEVGCGGVAKIVFEGPGLCAYTGGAGVDVDRGGEEDRLFEVDFGSGYREVEGVRVGKAGDVGIVGYASRFDVGEVGGVVDVVEHVDVAESDFYYVAEAPFLRGGICVHDSLLCQIRLWVSLPRCIDETRLFSAAASVNCPLGVSFFV